MFDPLLIDAGPTRDHPLDVEVGPNDAIQPAGIVMSVMDGMIVLMGSANAPVLSEG